MEPFYVGGYWRSRRETLDECATRLSDCLDRLTQVDELLSSWFLKARSKKAAREPVKQDLASLTALLEKGRNRTDVGGEVIDELGFSAGLWNRRSDSVGLRCSVGKYASPGISNVFLLELPDPEGAGFRLYERDVATAVITAVVQAWDPDWATYSSSSLRESQGWDETEPVVGWLTYLRSASEIDLGVNVQRHPVGQGQLITIGDKVDDASPAAVTTLTQTLRGAGALRGYAH